VRAKLAVRGTARGAPSSDGRPGRLGRDALVDWHALVDDLPMSAAELARVEAAGSTLMRAGHRWVRIDPAGVRRARKLLDEQIASRSNIDAIGVLQLAAGDTGESTVPVELTTDDRPGADSDWIRSLLEGLPDDRLEEAKESGTFCGELRHYQRRGLAWMQFLARLGLGGCLADAMGLGKTATTLAHLVDRPGPHLV